MQKDFSIVIPIYNEQESIRELISNIKRAFSGVKKTYEMIFIDDGSTDKTLSILKNVRTENKDIKIYSFRKNLGKSPALMLGFARSTGKTIVTLDADLQDDPSNIMALYQKLTKNGYDIVTGWRKDRKDNIFKIMSSQIFNKIVSVLFGLKLHDLNSGLKIYKSEAAKDLKIYGGMHRFIPIIAQEMGYKVAEKEILHHPRKYGFSKYKFTKIFTDVPDLITIYFLTKYTRRPLHFFGKIGAFVFTIGFIILLYLSYLRFIGERIGGRPLLLFGVLLVLTGMQIIFTGLLADLIVNINSKDDDDFLTKFEQN
ncbi:MAG: glycosyl transferase [Candidatus Levybacteria bacterium RIFCSPLOWO2_12_FULL_39_17]|nr:MAG: glycosyl transferase [Candidatus Levybacteria bacterium RIFCSPLOWO2_12_FULL_39_17]